MALSPCELHEYILSIHTPVHKMKLSSNKIKTVHFKEFGKVLESGPMRWIKTPSGHINGNVSDFPTCDPINQNVNQKQCPCVNRSLPGTS